MICKLKSDEELRALVDTITPEQGRMLLRLEKSSALQGLTDQKEIIILEQLLSHGLVDRGNSQMPAGQADIWTANGNGSRFIKIVREIAAARAAAAEDVPPDVSGEWLMFS
ncbi:MAG: hypothetical protein HYS12_27840 [Planctomycetes bacterium]|nr:hypothetical protein [Planctomycetota bacterium]